MKAGNGLSADLHEFQLTPQGTALITAYYPVFWNASSIGGSRRQIVFDGVVQEIDIPTGLVLFQWDSLDHVPLSASYSHLPKRRAPFDYFHVNSVAQDKDGNLIISARNTWAAYKVKRSNGSIMWTLGGKHSSFRFGRGRASRSSTTSGSGRREIGSSRMFDDGAGPPPVHKQSRALELALNFTKMTANIVGQELHSPALSANFEGNVQQPLQPR